MGWRLDAVNYRKPTFYAIVPVAVGPWSTLTAVQQVAEKFQGIGRKLQANWSC